MKTIILYGHQDAAQEAYQQIDAMLRERHVGDVKLVITTHVEQATARGLRQAGGALWYCGPTLQPPGGGWSPVIADAYLLGRTVEMRGKAAIAAVLQFLQEAASA